MRVQVYSKIVQMGSVVNPDLVKSGILFFYLDLKFYVSDPDPGKKDKRKK